MSIKDIKEAMEKDNVYFGIKEAIRNPKKTKKVFIARDARAETLDKLKSLSFEPGILKTKEDISKELNLDFECEVFSIR